MRDPNYFSFKGYFQLKEISGVRMAKAILAEHALRQKLHDAGLLTSTLTRFIKLEQQDKVQYGDYYTLSDEMARRVEMLLGPNATTYFKIWGLHVK